MDFDAFADAWLGGLERDGTLAPGAAAALVRHYKADPGRRQTPAALAEAVVGLLAGDDPARLQYLNPARPLPGVDRRHPFAVEADLLRPLLSEPGANGLASRFAIKVGRMASDHDGKPTPGRMAGAMVDALFGFEDRDNWRYLRPEYRPAPPPWEQRIAAVLGELRRRGVIRRDADVAALAAERDWAALGRKPRREAVMTTVDRLRGDRRDLVAPGVEVAAPLAGDPIWRDEAREAAVAELRAELAGARGLVF